MEFVEMIKSYLEVGLLGLCGCLIAYMAYNSYKNNKTKQDEDCKTIKEKDDKNDERFNKILDLIQKQNQDYQNQQTQQLEILMNKIINGVVTHTVTPEENDKLTKISMSIDNHLQDILEQTDASRVSLIQYHNGGRSINKQSFLKMSMTNERVKVGVSSVSNIFKDIFRSSLSYITRELDDNGYCFIDDVDEMKSLDVSVYESLTERGIESKYTIALKNIENSMVIAYIGIDYIDKGVANKEVITKVLNEKKQIIETLLNL